MVSASLVVQLVKNSPAIQETLVRFLGQEDPLEKRIGYPLQSSWASLVAGKESTCNVGYLGSIPGLGRSTREGNGYPLQYSSLENSMDCLVHGIAKSQTQLSEFHFHFSSSLPFLFWVSKTYDESCKRKAYLICCFLPFQSCFSRS